MFQLSTLVNRLMNLVPTHSVTLNGRWWREELHTTHPLALACYVWRRSITSWTIQLGQAWTRGMNFFLHVIIKNLNYLQISISNQNFHSKEQTNTSLTPSTFKILVYVNFFHLGPNYLCVCNSLYSNLSLWWIVAMSYETLKHRFVWKVNSICDSETFHKNI